MDSRRPHTRDLARSYFCSEAVLFEKNEEIKEYLNDIKSEYPIVQFDMVHVSVDQENDQRGFKFLVAYAADATFIAFRGARNFDGLGREIQSSSSASEFHGEVLELSRSFMGSDCTLLAQLYASGKRIIFCGHRLGGAVAHMVVVRFFKDIKVKVEDLEPDTMISFAFGAPNICGNKRAQEINDNARVKAHFFTVLNESDPLASLQDGLEGHEIMKGDSAVRAGRWVRRYPIGEEIQLPSGYYQSRSTAIMGSCVPGKIKPWNREKFSHCYKSAVVAACKLSSIPREDISAKMKVDSPSPHILSAKWKASDFKIFITIKGFNLLFLREPVKLDGLHPWETIVLHTESELVVTAPDNTKAEDIKAVSMVILKTAFGATTQVIQQDIDGDTTETPLKVLPRIIQTFFVLASPPLSSLPPTKTLQDLDIIIQCVPDLKDKKLSELLRATSKAGVTEEDLKTYAKEMNDIIDSVIEFLRRSYILHTPKHKPLVIFGCVAGCLLLAVGLVLLPVGGMALAIGGVGTIAASVTAGGALFAGGGGGIIALALGKGRIMVREYTDMLQLAIYEASLWHEKTKSRNIQNHDWLQGSASDCKPTTATLESLLQEEVECSAGHLESMIEKILKSGKTNIELSSESLRIATVESKHNLVRRMHIVAKTISTYNKEVKSTGFLGIVGAEDAGKSTFIMKAIRRFGENPSGEVPEVGFKCHTTTVRPYKLKGSLYLVDFPGSDGTEKYAKAWKQFTSLPSSCILLLDFKGDIKKDQMKMYKKMKKDLDSKVVVVFNKVDLLFSEEEKFDADYFKVHRVKTAHKLGCNSEDVHYVCLDPRNKETLIELLKMGVLDFEGLAKKVGGWLAMHSTSGSHHILME